MHSQIHKDIEYILVGFSCVSTQPIGIKPTFLHIYKTLHNPAPACHWRLPSKTYYHIKMIIFT